MLIYYIVCGYSKANFVIEKIIIKYCTVFSFLNLFKKIYYGSELFLLNDTTF